MERRSSTNQPNDAHEHEIELWLSSKLSNPWSAERIANQLTPEILASCTSQYERLKFMETPIKLRLLSSCLSLKKKSFSELGPYFQTLLDRAQTDEEDEWVRVISNLLSV